MSARYAPLLLALLLMVVASAVAVVWARQENRQLFVELVKLQDERDALNVQYTKLELEQATLANPLRIEQKAREVLGMVPPDREHTRLISP